MHQFLFVVVVASVLAFAGAQTEEPLPERPPFPEEVPPPGNDTVDPSIVKGQRVAQGEIPWQAYLLETHPNNAQTACGGSLIRPTWILTAAHCIAGVSTDVFMGSTNLQSMTYGRRASRRLPHPNYNTETLENDIAVLLLPAAPSGPGVGMIALAPANTGPLDNVVMRVSGFGNVQTGGPSSDDLLKVNLRSISNDECRRHTHVVRPSTLCANWSSEPGQSICQGDSGGPLTVQLNNGQYMQTGVVSFTLGSCTRNQPQGFARVSSFRNWIDQTIQQNS